MIKAWNNSTTRSYLMNTNGPQPLSLLLWPKIAPGTEHWSHAEQETVMPFTNIKLVRNVTQPTLMASLPDPDVATGAAILICPGGGFYSHTLANEGTDVARWFAALGVAAFVLKYPLVPTPTQDQGFLQLVPYVVLRSGFPLDKEKQDAIAEQKRAHVPLAVMDGKQALKDAPQDAGQSAIFYADGHRKPVSTNAARSSWVGRAAECHPGLPHAGALA
jgi:hypothetical protein